MTTKLAGLLSLILLMAPLARGQDDAMPNIDEEMKKAMAAKPKSAAEMEAMQKHAEADSKKMMEESDKEEAAEKAKQKTANDAALHATGPVALPDWTPQVPQFAASGPVARKMIDGQPRTVLTGTSPLTPQALCDSWDSFKADHPKFSHERTGSVINHHSDLSVMYRNGEDNTEVKMEADRKPGDKVTQVTVSSPLPVLASPEK
jgi:hypothetical protein